MLPSPFVSHLERLLGARVRRAERLGDDAHPEGDTEKGLGYGAVVRVELRSDDGGERTVVVHVPRPNAFGHERRADRVEAIVLALDTFAAIPHHVPLLDAGVLGPDGAARSLRDTAEPYFVTEWATGDLYADDLRRLGQSGKLETFDEARLDILTGYLVQLHSERYERPSHYLRAIRDLVGDGEGIAGLADSFSGDVPGASRQRIESIEASCLAWRHRLRARVDRLCRTHGDFHPFNLLFDGDRLHVLDASRGCSGDAADDLAALTINFLFFGVSHRQLWLGGLGALWMRFWDRYLRDGDAGVVETLAPFFAWRGLVVTSPAWYPKLAGADRDRILTFVETVLDTSRFDPAMGERAMR